MTENVILCGDCLELMKQLPDGCVDAIITDPPYGIKRSHGLTGARTFNHKKEKKIELRYYDDNWDNQRPDKIYFDEILRIGKTILIFGGNYFADLLPQSTHWIVWDKQQTMPTFSDAELVWTNIRRSSVKIKVCQYNGLLGKEITRYHPTQKPLELMKWIVHTYSRPGDLILDPFAGSGTTLVAAKQLGRKYLGIELNPDYVKIAEDRLRQEEMF